MQISDRKTLSTILLFTVLISGCKKALTQKEEEKMSALNSNSSLSTVLNPWGVLITASSSDPSTATGLLKQDLTTNYEVLLATEYGVKYIRTNISYADWTSNKGRFLGRYDNFSNSGFSILLNIIWQDPTLSGGVLIPAAFPDNANNPSSTYYKYVKAVVDSLSTNGRTPPAVMVVENEENNKTFHVLDDSSDYQKYIVMTEAVMAICHPKGIKVTNGALTERALTYATWDWLKNVKGRTTEAQTFAKNSMPPSSYYTLYKPKPDNIKYASLTSINSQIAMINYYIKDYKTSSLDYINFHWYEPAICRAWHDDLNGGSPWSQGINKNDTSAGAMDHVLEYLTMATGHKKVISNEIGQMTQSDCLTRKIMEKIISRPYNAFAIASWFDGDGDDDYDAKAMHNTFLLSPFYTIRNTGITFRKVIKNPYGVPACSPLQ